MGKIQKSKIELKKEQACQKKSGLGTVMYRVENKNEKIDTDLLERFKCNALGFHHVSFWLSAEEGINNAISELSTRKTIVVWSVKRSSGRRRSWA